MPGTRRTLDLNADLGEGFPWDDRLLDRVTSASIACGGHAGDRETALRTLEAAARRGVLVGAHPGYPDRAGFGRRQRDEPPSTIRDLLLDQVGWLADLASSCCITVAYVKPHGALYNQAQRDPRTASGVLDGVERLGLPLLGMPGSILERAARERGVRFVSEGFSDRRYGADGLLLPRGVPGAVIDDPAAVEAQVLALLASKVDTLCIHGDHPGSVDLAPTLRAILERNGIQPQNFLAG